MSSLAAAPAGQPYCSAALGCTANARREVLLQHWPRAVATTPSRSPVYVLATASMSSSGQPFFCVSRVQPPVPVHACTPSRLLRLLYLKGVSMTMTPWRLIRGDGYHKLSCNQSWTVGTDVRRGPVLPSIHLSPLSLSLALKHQEVVSW
jgi:hypothetical protein